MGRDRMGQIELLHGESALKNEGTLGASLFRLPVSPCWARLPAFRRVALFRVSCSRFVLSYWVFFCLAGVFCLHQDSPSS